MTCRNEEQSWMKYAGSIQSGNPHSSVQIDEIVYGTKPELNFYPCLQTTDWEKPPSFHLGGIQIFFK